VNQLVAELLLECADALDMAVVDCTHRDNHYARISELAASKELPARVIDLLQAIEDRMRHLATLDELEVAVQDRERDRAMAEELRGLAAPSKSYLYHGTVFGRLKSIQRQGLVPAKLPVWTNREHVKAHCRDAVFFTGTWRRAVTWADTAHLHTRGRRDSAARRPVIIRVPAEGLVVESDPVAMAPGCLLVRGAVSTSEAEIFVAPLVGFPHWQRLSDLARG